MFDYCHELEYLYLYQNAEIQSIIPFVKMIQAHLDKWQDMSQCSFTRKRLQVYSCYHIDCVQTPPEITSEYKLQLHFN